ncbi:MAG: heme-dependent oxidative N-demethylase family protein [Acidimicrobiales bacterium]
MTADDSWFDEIDLDPQRSSLAMGTRALGDRPWLVTDDCRGEELALKASLCAERHAEVFAALDDTETAGATVEAMVQLALVEAGVPTAPTATHRPAAAPTEPAKSGGLGRAEGPRSPDFTTTDQAWGGTSASVGRDDELHPLDRAGRSTQEDLCLLRRRDDGWYLEAASLCFPSRWRLADKIGRHITEVHGPVHGYAEHLASKIDLLFDRLTDRPVWRRNWFLYADPALFQPSSPVDGDPIIEAARVLEDVVVRSERQTLRRLPDDDCGGRWVLFTIRVQQAPLAAFCGDVTDGGDRRLDALDRYLDGADPGSLEHRGLTPGQVAEIRTALAVASSP